MFRFEHDYYLIYLAGLVPLVVLLYLSWIWYQKQGSKLGEMGLIRQITVFQSARKRKWSQILTLLIFALLIIAWANPQWGAKREKVKTRSTDIFIALDISNSMYCEDVAPSRLELARKFTLDLIEELKGERIGLILFAGNAYLQMPLTTDYAAAQIFVRSANPGMAATQGTALGDAIDKATEGFTGDPKFHRTLIIISDGEDHDAEAIEKARAAQDDGMLIFTVGVGTAEGSFIPIQTRGSQDWKRDNQGQPVRTSLNETLLNELASVGGGEYFYLNGTTTILNALDNKIENLEKEEFEERSFTSYESYFQLFLGGAVVLLILQWLLNSNLSIKETLYARIK